MILSHIPVHPDSKGRFAANIHGHLHSNRVRKPRGVDAKTGTILYSNDIDPWYFNVSVEQIRFKPILFETVLDRIKQQGQPEYTYEGFSKFIFE
jgi:calcineurin-like phosphoesterase family protein